MFVQIVKILRGVIFFSKKEGIFPPPPDTPKTQLCRHRFFFPLLNLFFILQKGFPPQWDEYRAEWRANVKAGRRNDSDQTSDISCASLQSNFVDARNVAGPSVASTNVGSKNVRNPNCQSETVPSKSSSKTGALFKLFKYLFWCAPFGYLYLFSFHLVFGARIRTNNL